MTTLREANDQYEQLNTIAQQLAQCLERALPKLGKARENIGLIVHAQTMINKLKKLDGAV